MTDQTSCRFTPRRCRPASTRPGAKCARAMLLALGVLASGCQHGVSVFDPVNRSIARRAVNKADRLLASGQLADSLRSYERAASFDDRYAPAHAGIGRIRALQGRDESAAEHLAAAVRHAPDNAAYAVQLADVLMRTAAMSVNRRSLLAAAIRALRHAASIDPTDATVVLRLAACHRQLGDGETAMSLLEGAKTIDANLPDVYIALGRMLDERFEYERALAEFKAAVKLDPDNPVAHYGCGAVSLTLSERHPENPMYRARAVAHLRRSLELDPDQPAILDMLRTSAPPQLRAVTAAGDGE